MDNMKLLNWFLENARGLDIFFTVFGVVIEVLLTVALFILYKHFKNKNKED